MEFQNEELEYIKYRQYKKTRTHEKPFVLNANFRAAASNVSSGSLPAGSAVLQKEISSFRKLRIIKIEAQSGITLRFVNILISN